MSSKFFNGRIFFNGQFFFNDEFFFYGLTSTMIGSHGQNYWTRESNETIIKRKCDIPLREEKRRKCNPNFYKSITPKKLIKRRKDVTKVFLK